MGAVTEAERMAGAEKGEAAMDLVGAGAVVRVAEASEDVGRAGAGEVEGVVTAGAGRAEEGREGVGREVGVVWEEVATVAADLEMEEREGVALAEAGLATEGEGGARRAEGWGAACRPASIRGGRFLRH